MGLPAEGQKRRADDKHYGAVTGDRAILAECVNKVPVISLVLVSKRNLTGVRDAGDRPTLEKRKRQSQPDDLQHGENRRDARNERLLCR